MITLETTITHTEKKELKISTPSFWKDPSGAYYSYCAVLDENTFVEVRSLYNGDIRDIQNSSVKKATSKILRAQQEWVPITEKEFFGMYDEVYDSIRLQPMVVDTGRAEALRDFERTQNF